MNFIKKYKKVLFGLLCIVLVAIVSIQVFYLWINVPFIIPGSSLVSHTKYELIDLYRENRDELNKAAEAILTSDLFLDKIKDGEDGDEYILFKSDSQYFSKSDWEAIVDVFKTLRPYSIDRSLRDGYDVVYIVFTERTEDGVKKHNNLYYIKDAEAVKCYEEYIWVGELEHIDGYWYIDQWSNEEIINATQET